MPLTIGYTNIFDLAGHGAQETLYFQQGASENLEDMLSLCQPLADKRRPLLGKQASIKAIKCFIAETPEGVMNPRLSLLKKMYLPGHNDHGSAESSISLQVQFVSGDKKRKKLMSMVAPWDEIFNNQDSLDRTITGWDTHWGAWATAIIGAGMGWYRTTWSANVPIIGYTTDAATGMVTLAFPVGAATWPKGFHEPQAVKIRFPGKSPLDGKQVLIPIDATHAILSKPIGVRPFSVVGTLQIPTRVFTSVNAGGGQLSGIIRPQGPVRRKRGRPLLAPRGRVAERVRF